MKELKNLLLVIIGAAFFVGMFMICDRYAQDVTEEYSSQITPSLVSGNTSGNDTSVSDNVNVEQMVQDMVEDGYSSDITITAAGDILSQTDSVERAYDSESETFDYSSCFSKVEDILKSSDLSVATLKTTLAGAYNGESSEIAGYGTASSLSNSPEILAENMADAGIGVVNLATNHTMDSGVEGLKSTLDYLTQAGISAVGCTESENGDKTFSTEIGGISVGICGYCNYINQSFDSSYDYMVNCLDDYDTSKVSDMCSTVTKLKDSNEIVIVMLNFGSVSDTTADDQQRSVADKLVNAGADIILGTGSRVVKPMEVITVTDDNGQVRNGFVFYGLGALMTSENYSSDSGLDTDLGALITFNIYRYGVGNAAVTGFNVVPLYISKQDSGIIPVPICYTIDTGENTDQFTDTQLERMQEGYEGVITKLLDGSDLNYSYEDYEYSVSIQ